MLTAMVEVHVDIFAEKEFKDSLNKKTFLKTDQLGSDAYYFKPGQVLDYHKHKTDQIFFILQGSGTFYLDDEKEEKKIPVQQGVSVLAPKHVWHKMVNDSNSELIAVQVTYLPTDAVQRG